VSLAWPPRTHTEHVETLQSAVGDWVRGEGEPAEDRICGQLNAVRIHAGFGLEGPLRLRLATATWAVKKRGDRGRAGPNKRAPRLALQRVGTEGV
jgi:hypothetical protein